VPLDFTDVALRFLSRKSAALDDDGDIVNRHKNPSSGVATVPEIRLGRTSSKQDRKKETSFFRISRPLYTIEQKLQGFGSLSRVTVKIF